MRIAIVFSLLIGVLAIIFAVMNPLSVDVNFGFARIQGAPLPLVLIITLLLGVLIGYLMWFPSKIAANRKIRGLQKSAREVEFGPSFESETEMPGAPTDEERK